MPYPWGATPPPPPHLIATQQLSTAAVDAIRVWSHHPAMPVILQLQQPLLANRAADHCLHGLPIDARVARFGAHAPTASAGARERSGSSGMNRMINAPNTTIHSA